ncbi:hypothetical protein JCM9279_002461 [Rhodotorula babjevae]
MVTASLNGTVLAESANTQVVEGNHGVASYLNAVVDGKEIKDAAWYYPKTTTEKAKPIENWVAFYGSKVQVK